MVLKNDFGRSLGLHAAIFLACLWTIQYRATHSPAPLRPIEIELIENKAPARTPPREAPSKQLVRTRQLNNEKIPTEKAFLGERNQVAERQQVSSRGGDRVGSRASSEARPRVADLGVAILPEARAKRQAQEGDARIREYVAGMKEGEETALSTREYVFFGYFERIRGRLDRAWEPILREHLVRHYRQGRRLASETDHSTKVQVLLDAAGRIRRVEVLSESGVEILDEAAIRAFNQAGPFPNPPQGLLEADGTVRIQWEFILKT